MMRSMFSGVSGLRSHQTMMDVVGNNIANVNTPGFKSSTVTFAETISQILRGSGNVVPGLRGGQNPIQIGLGVRVAAIDGVFTQGASQVTGRNTDLAIQGNGFFIVRNGAEQYYTRSGSFAFDSVGNLVAPEGYLVQGWMADANGVIDTDTPVGAITLPLNQAIEPLATTSVAVGGNLSANEPIGATATTSINVYDSLGNAHELTVTFTKVAANEWDVTGTVGEPPVAVTVTSGHTSATSGNPAVTFDTSGNVALGPPVSFSFNPPTPAATPVAPMNVTLELGGASPLAQFGGASTASALDQNGQAKGDLRDFAIGDTGDIVGQFSNGETKLLGQVALAAFNNPAGLERQGNSHFQSTTNSGEAQIGTPGSGARGLLSAGTLEMSNVELSREFTNLIIAQRGFQANSRVITTSDEMLSELVNLKR